ncbi:MAG TPA: DUF362 domain-containing protein [Caldithrix abyssi]|uniref:DUF362 domain-containing protein n=1 Tax=Caldithrix abyssi TaxID=187145 RepID=A0A7V4U3N1_CALAY|nr:DUF362 domain-containing protein [Caldithrix abyssi]
MKALNNMNRRKFLIITGLLTAAASAIVYFRNKIKHIISRFDQYPGTDYPYEEVPAEIYLSKNGTPQQNVAKVIEMMGGIQKIIGKKDIVILKPNMQWWNQGRTNLAAMKGFIDLVLGIPGFEGEVIIAENNHFMDTNLPPGEQDNVRGWIHLSEINGEIDGENHNVLTLLELYRKQGYKNVTKYHWRDGGPKLDIWGNGQDGGLVKSVAEGDGYIWGPEEYHFTGFLGLKTWKVMMSYPVFTSAYSGISIDLRRGAFRRDGKGGATFLPDRPVKLINFAVLNDHGKDTGITSAIKNYMGITDLSCGWWGIEPEGYHSVHGVGELYYLHARAGAIAYFMKHIRRADLNIVTAEWVGWGNRTDIKRAARARTILASTDPIALDYYSSKHIVFPLSKMERHDPDLRGSAINKFLHLALKVYGKGTLDETKMTIHTHDFSA